MADQLFYNGTFSFVVDIYRRAKETLHVHAYFSIKYSEGNKISDSS